MAPKLTESFNDKAASGNPFGNGLDRLHITPAHEPLRGELHPQIPIVFSPSNPFMPLQTSLSPTPPPAPVAENHPAPKKRGRPKNSEKKARKPEVKKETTKLVQTQIVPPVAPAPQMAPLKVALVGTAPSSRMLAPFDDKSWQIWGCSPGNMNILPRVDAWFELHTNLLWPEHKHYGAPYIEWLKKAPVPVFMQDRRYLPNAQIFPKDRLVQEFGGDFFTSSFAWMMAFAIMLGAKEIALYGIDMASRDEYILQRPGFFYFKNIAQMRGIRVSAPNESDIMMPPGLYGYSDDTPFGRKLLARRKEIKDRVAQMIVERDKLSQNITYLQGADEDNDYTISIWMGAMDNPHPNKADGIVEKILNTPASPVAAEPLIKGSGAA